MFSFFKKKQPSEPVSSEPVPSEAAPSPSDSHGPGSTTTPEEKRGWLERLRNTFADEPVTEQPVTEPAEYEPESAIQPAAQSRPEIAPASAPALTPMDIVKGLFGFEVEQRPEQPLDPLPGLKSEPEPVAESEGEPGGESEGERRGWFDKLRGGLRKTGTSITQVFTGTQIDDALYEELESALLMADAGVRATEFLLADLKRRVKQAKASDPHAVKELLADSITELLTPLERGLEVGKHVPTVIMVVGVNGAGKTTSIGKLTRHLADAQQKVLLAAADTFRAAAREQLAVWAGRNRVEIVGQEGGDPAAVTFDAVVAGKARGCDVVIADTAGRLTTQVHLMDELKKIRRVIAKAQPDAPHEVLLVVDGNTGQNALAQVQTFDAALQLTGLIITKLDGTAKGGVLAAIALWSQDRAASGRSALPVYFIGVGEKLEDLQTFKAREFAQALLD
jgi:fused signal recognition particle receptor